jgi:iron complex transport system ATP-binding protein
MSRVIELHEVSVVRDGKTILGPITWQVNEGERWVVLGPNGAGKSTLFNICSTLIHPSSGQAEILGEKLGSVDVFELRTRIGLTAPSLATYIPEDERVMDLVLTAAYAIVGRWQEEYELWDESRAMALLTTLGVRALGDRIYSTLSDGEKKRVLIARALMADPELLLLDEPAAGLDLGGREDLLTRLAALSVDAHAPVSVVVTHHIEEIPVGTTHALLLSSGKVVAQGAIAEVVTGQNLSTAYGLSVTVNQDAGRYFARASHSG